MGRRVGIKVKALIGASLVVLLTISGCSDTFLDVIKEKIAQDEAEAGSKDITAFSFLAVDNAELSADVVATITGTDITATFVPYGTDVTALVASFGTTGVSVAVGGTTQVSGVTANNFTNPVTYRVTAEDSSYQDYTVTVTGPVIEMVSVPANTTGFSMGYTGVSTGEPVHTVASISAFSMGKYEVKYADWTAVKIWAESNGYSFVNHEAMGDGTGDTDQHPVTKITWRDAIAWCNALSEMDGLTPVYYNMGQAHTTANVYRNSFTGGDIGNTDVEWNANGYRLPTDAEWEYAARYIDGSSFTPGDQHSGYNIDTNPDNCAWYSVNAGSTHVVGTRTANSLGIYDMSGNVWEWCWDWWGAYTTSSPYIDADTRGPSSGTYRVIRGGGLLTPAQYLRVAYRGDSDPQFIWHEFGFRLVRTAE